MIKRIFRQSFGWTKNRKDMFVLLFFTQLAYLIVFLTVFVYGFMQIMYHANFLLEGFYSITPEQIAANMIDNPLALYSHYSSFIGAVILLIVLSYVVYLVINGINWSLTNKIVNENQRFFRFFPKYIVMTLIFTVPLMLISYFFIRAITITGLQAMFLTILAVIIIVFWYFMCTSFGLIYRYRGFRTIQRHLYHTFLIGYKKSRTLVPITIFTVVLIAFLGAMIYLTSDIFPLLLIFIILFVLALVWTRILCMTAVRNASEDYFLRKSGKKRKKKK